MLSDGLISREFLPERNVIVEVYLYDSNPPPPPGGALLTVTPEGAFCWVIAKVMDRQYPAGAMVIRRIEPDSIPSGGTSLSEI